MFQQWYIFVFQLIKDTFRFYTSCYSVLSFFFDVCVFWSSAYLLSLKGPGWLNELGSWIIQQLIQVYHQYGVGSRPAF